MSEAQNVQSPIGDLEWVFITGNGKKDPQGNDRFVASLVLPTDSDECTAFKAEIDTYWKKLSLLVIKN